METPMRLADNDNRPNLFEQAPSELAQDAFFAWLFGWLNFPDHPLCAISRTLTELILLKFDIAVAWQDFLRVDVRRQFHSIDLLVVLAFKSRPKLCLLIEDKVDARLLNDLRGYRKKVLENASSWPPLEDLTENSIRVVVVKLGYDYDMPEGEGWKKLNWADLWRWTQTVRKEFSAGVSSSEILADWLQFQETRFQEIDRLCTLASRHIEELLDTRHPEEPDNRSDGSHWCNPILQYAFIKRVFSISTSDIEAFEYDRYTWLPLALRSGFTYIGLGNSAGRPWTLCTFDPQKNMDYRLGCRAGMWGLSLRSFFNTEDGARPKGEQEERIRSATAKFRELLSFHGISEEKYTPRQNANETTRVLVDPCQGRRLLALADVHREFVNWLNTR